MNGLRFLFDRCCPERLARVVAAYDAENTVRFLDDDARFEPTTADVTWVGALAADLPWAAVSMDAKILTRPHERAALRNSGVKFFLLGKGWMRMAFHDQAWRLLKTWPNVVEAAGSGLNVTPIRG